MTKPLIVLIMLLLPWLPWTEEAITIIEESRALVIFPEETWGGRGLCCGPKPDIRISKYCISEDIPMVALHETQHLLPFLYGTWDWNNAFSQWDGWRGFEPTAIACVKETRPTELKAALKFADLGAWELHAQLPWLLNGKLCPKLQPWYPWFRVTE